MPGGRGNIRPEDRTQGFEKHPENINKKGAPPSIRNQLRKIMEMDGVMKIKPEHVKKINEDGSVEIVMPKKDAIAMKLMQWALSAKGQDSLKAIQLVMDRTEGRPLQSVDVSLGNVNVDPKEWVDEAE